MACWAGSIAVDRSLVDRFASALDKLRPAGERIGLAVSGGPDSMAMLLLMHEISANFAVATVNHGLRAEAAQECSLVAQVCAQRGIVCDVLNVALASGNVQQEARRARYGALGEWAQASGLSALATAHHADDQAETVLMRLNRGSGLAGLAGIRKRGNVEGCAVPVIRPVLGLRRAELAQIVTAAGVQCAHYPSNEDRQYDRVKIRHALADAPWLDTGAIARSVAHLASLDQALAAMADLLWEQRSEIEATLALPVASLAEVNARLLERGIEWLGGQAERGDVFALAVRLRDGEQGNVGGILIRRNGQQFVCSPEPARGPR